MSDKGIPSVNGPPPKRGTRWGILVLLIFGSLFVVMLLRPYPGVRETARLTRCGKTAAYIVQAQYAHSTEQAQKGLRDPITTEIAPAGPFWIAEGYHQQWDEKHGSESCPLPRHARTKSGS